MIWHGGRTMWDAIVLTNISFLWNHHFPASFDDVSTPLNLAEVSASRSILVF